jgi:hypothetical protein
MRVTEKLKELVHGFLVEHFRAGCFFRGQVHLAMHSHPERLPAWLIQEKSATLQSM